MSTSKTDDGTHISSEFREEHRDRDHPPTAEQERQEAERRREEAQARIDRAEQPHDLPTASPQNMMVTNTAAPERAPQNRRAEPTRRG